MFKKIFYKDKMNKKKFHSIDHYAILKFIID